MQDAGTPALQFPALPGDGCRERLSVRAPVELEHRVAAEHEPVDRTAVDRTASEPGATTIRDRLSLEPREQQDSLGG